MTLNWIKCDGNNWCNFMKVDLSNKHFDGLEGVYIIWHGSPNPAVVRVGQGIIKDRLAAHRQEREIAQYETNGGLYATWAAVDAQHRDGVETFLGTRLSPKVGSNFPRVLPIEVNLPW